MRTLPTVLAASLVAAFALPMLPTALAGDPCTTPGPNQICQFFCDVGDFVHVYAWRSGFGSVHGVAACGGASASCLETGFDADCEATSLTPATKWDIGVCNTDTTDSRATCWAGPLVR